MYSDQRSQVVATAVPLERTPAASLVVLPTYNERETLGDVVSAVVRHGYDVLVVDDNSPDGTGVIADRLAESHAQVQVFHRSRKLGLGSAYRTGFRFGLQRSYKFIVEMDSDGSHDPEDLDRLIASARTSDGLSIGSRYITGGGTRGWSVERRLLSRAANTLCRSTLRRALHDWTSGFRCYSVRVFDRVRLEDLSANGFSLQIELAYRCLQNAVPVVEVPITFREREAGTSKASKAEILEALGCVARLRSRARPFSREATIQARSSPHND